MKYHHKTIHEKEAAKKLFADTDEQVSVRFNLSERCARIENLISISLSDVLKEKYWNIIRKDCTRIFVSFYRQSEWGKIIIAKLSLLEELDKTPGDNKEKFLKLKELIAILEKAA
jgi:hypothetical protein